MAVDQLLLARYRHVLPTDDRRQYLLHQGALADALLLGDHQHAVLHLDARARDQGGAPLQSIRAVLRDRDEVSHEIQESRHVALGATDPRRRPGVDELAAVQRDDAGV